MPIFSLPSKYGIGTFGDEAYRFVNFLRKSGQSCWQLLPLNPTSYGDSPYQSFSSAAGNPYFIDLDYLKNEELLKPEEYENVDFGSDYSSVDYKKLYDNRFSVLRIAFERFKTKEKSEYDRFCSEHSEWLDSYALFMAIKDANGGVSWNKWDSDLRFREENAIRLVKEKYSDDIEFYKFIQFKFYEQWLKLKSYAAENGIKIIGDMPMYVSYDSADVWQEPEQFDLDENLCPNVVAGCPPDAFSADGQLWGNPVYNWQGMKSGKDPYRWWKNRMKNAFLLYDIVRIDHFRGFESFYCIKYGEETARDGFWRKGPGMELFDAFYEEFGDNLPIIAEDLGFLTKEVKELLKKSGFPGMKVLQFAFDAREDSDYMPHNYERNCVVYTGTHDNDTVMGWTRSAAPEDVYKARRYMHVDDNEGFNWAMIRTAMMSVADTAILMMPDFMGLGSEARINTPSTIGGNWLWRINGGCINDWLAGIIRENTELYGRIPPKDQIPLKN